MIQTCDYQAVNLWLVFRYKFTYMFELRVKLWRWTPCNSEFESGFCLKLKQLKQYRYCIWTTGLPNCVTIQLRNCSFLLNSMMQCTLSLHSAVFLWHHFQHWNSNHLFNVQNISNASMSFLWSKPHNYFKDDVIITIFFH